MDQNFMNPQSGALGMGMAQNAESTLKWRPIYQRYVLDSMQRGEEPEPMEMFIQNVTRAQQQQMAVPQPPPALSAGHGLFTSKPQGLRA